MFTRDAATVREKLKRVGVAPTVQRMAIAAHLFKADHPTAAEVFAGVRADLPRVSQATVYNNLHTFVEAGLVREVRIGSDAPVRYDGNPRPHHHLLDTASGRLVDIPLDEVQISNRAELEQKYNVTRITMVLEGSVSPTHDAVPGATNTGD